MNTKTDRVLIELAAKAYGLDGSQDKDIARYVSKWNPLVNDGHAFGLMVALGLTPHFYSEHGTTLIVVDDVNDPEGCDVIVRWNGDMLSATRRAIVIAAAKIGEGV